MTRKSKRELEREVRDLSDRAGEDDDWFRVVCEHDDGTLTDTDGDPVPEDAVGDDGIVLRVSWDVAQTWP